MTTVLDSTRTEESYLMLAGITWTQFEAIEAAFAEIAGVRFVYLDGILQIMTLSPEHEDTKGTIRALLEAYLREKNIRFYIRGSATLGSKDLGARKEPDESYNIGTKKAIPDLVIEVVYTSGGIDKLKLYQRIGIPEVWFWEDGILTIYHLGEEYEKLNQSQLLPELDLTLMTKYIVYYDQYDAVTEFVQSLSQQEI
jgi:Uma2 family endonuclease